MEEFFKPVVGYEGYYEVSNLGNVYAIDRLVYNSKGYYENRKRKKLTFLYTKHGYVHVSLSKNNIKKRVSVHRIVASAFIPNPENKPQVNHLDLNKKNNKIDNLEWTTALENNRHAQYNKANCFGESHHKAKLSVEMVKEIRFIINTGIYTNAEIARVYMVSAANIREAICGKTWKNVDYPTSKHIKVDPLKLSCLTNDMLGKLKISQRQASDILNLTKQEICRAGKGKTANKNTALQICTYFGVPFKSVLKD